MFWRFGFHNASAIDSLLDKEDVQLEAILDEDDLLQECKGQNARLSDYFGRVDVLQRLFGYVTGSIESEEKGRYKYPYVATEVLCSDIWSIVDTCMKEQQQLLVPFWETVLDRTPEEMKTQTVMISHFTKITSIFLTKRPEDMFTFIRSQPNIIERLLVHIEAAPIQDLIIRIVQLDEQIPEARVAEWLSSENIMARLIGLLSPNHTPDIHTVVSDLLKNIILMATLSPAVAAAGEFGGGAAAGGNGRMANGGDPGGAQSGSASNRFARELAKRENVEVLVGYILTDFQAPPDTPLEAAVVSDTPTAAETKKDDAPSEPEPPAQLPDYESQVSSVIQSICMIIELIRRNNSDLFEPCLFHTLRNRLINIQHQEQLRQHETGETAVEDQRAVLEDAMRDMVDEMGVVHLGPVLDVLIPALSTLKSYLIKPRSSLTPVQTTIGPITPLTFERYRIAELLAELIHCSNMGLLNRPPGDSSDQLYDSEGRLQGGLHGLEELAQVISMTNSGSGDTYRDDGNSSDDMMLDDDEEDEEPFEREQLPVSQHPRVPAEGNDSLSLDSDDSMSGDDVDDNMILEDISIHEDPPSPSSHRREAANGATDTEALKLTIPESASPAQSPSQSTNSLPLPVTASPNTLSSSPSSQLATSPASSIRSRGSNTPSRKNSTRSVRSRRSIAGRSESRLPRERQICIGERLKKEYLNINLLPPLLDLFFEFPWNNFLHNAVYDVVHQILTGRMDTGYNRDLALALFRDAKLMHRIVDGSKRSDEAAAKPNGLRLGYMGHLTLMSEDVIHALARFPPELRLLVSDFAPKPEWEDYVTGRYDETKRKDSKLLGGGKPSASAGKGVTRWKVDEGDEAGATKKVGEIKGEFKRAGAGVAAAMPRQTADFGPPPRNEDKEDTHQPASQSQFARYLAQEIHSGSSAASSIPGSSDDDDDEDSEEEMEGGWLSQNQFNIPPRRPLDLDASSHGFDDSFGDGISSSAAARSFAQDPFGSNMDDDFGPFSDNHQARTNQADPFGFSPATSNSYSDDSFDSSFGDFGDFQSSTGDFGDFQAAGFSSPEREEGELTPTTGSWTFASASTSDSGVSETSDM